jgi:hypothetical protein
MKHKSWFEASVTLTEVLVEVHFGTKSPADKPTARQSMQTMYENGMLIFHKEANLICGPNCVEYAFKRTTPRARNLADEK